MPLRPSERRLLLVGAVVVAAAWLATQLPGWLGELERLRSGAGALERQVEAARLSVARAPQMAADVQAMAAALEPLGRVGPDGLAAWALAALQQVARESGVRLRELRPGALARSGELAVLSLQVTLEEQQAGVLRFLQKLERLAPQIAFERLQLSSRRGKDGRAGSATEAGTLSAVITLSAVAHATIGESELARYRELSDSVLAGRSNTRHAVRPSRPVEDAVALLAGRPAGSAMAGDVQQLFVPLPNYRPAPAAPATKSEVRVAASSVQLPARPSPARTASGGGKATGAKVAAPPPPQAAPVEQALPPPPAALRGIVRIGDTPYALLSAGGSEGYFRTGDQVSDWTVAAIEEASVVLRQGDREERLSLPTSFAVTPLQGSGAKGGSDK